MPEQRGVVRAACISVMRSGFLFPYVVYTVLLTLAVLFVAGSVPSLFALGFGFGPKIALVAAGEPLGDATRLPFIPYFVGMFARIRDNYPVALLLKNLIFQGLTAYVLAQLWLRSERSYAVLWMMAYLLTFPQLVRHGFSQIPEEGYLIPMFAFVFWGVMQASPGTRLIRLLPYALVTAITFLVKASVLFVGPAICLAYTIKTGSLRVFVLFFGLFSVAVAGWGLMNVANTGVVAVTSSLNA